MVQDGASLLFIDQKQTSADEVNEYEALHKEIFPDLPLKIINFFSAKFEDLQLISRHRVVLLPTFVVVGPSNKVMFKLSGRLPTSKDLELLREGTNNGDE
jgi:hypothetical protein